MDEHIMRLKRFVLCVALFLLPIISAAQLLIQNARIIDGTGASEFMGSVRIEGDRITETGDLQPLCEQIAYSHCDHPAFQQ